MTCYQEITCPECGSNEMMESGHSTNGTQRYRYQAIDGETKTFRLTYRCWVLKSKWSTWLSMVVVSLRRLECSK